MSEIAGAVGQISAASIAASATKEATQMQVDALNQQRAEVFNQLDPTKINAYAGAADTERAQNRLALQGITDPTQLANRYAAESRIAQQAQNLGQGSQQVSDVAVKEGIAGVPGMDKLKQQLVDQALHELSLGATLPPDVQNEIVKAGLEKAGQVQGSASAKGFGGQILRTQLGKAGIELQNQRQAKASALATTAQQLDSSRQQILGSLFPNLAQTQLGVLGGNQSVLQQSNSMVPESGLSGNDIANLWLARVGATNQLGQAASQAAAQGAMAQGQIWGNAVGGATRYGAQALPSTASTWNSILGGGSSGGGGSDLSSSDLETLFA